MEYPTVREGIGTYTIDPAHSEVGFVVSHMGFSKVRGRFEKLEGFVAVDPEDLSTLEARVDIAANSITTNNSDRDKHLRTNDFLDVQHHPTITFESTRVSKVEGNSITLEGDLSIRGVTKHVTVDGKYLGEGKDPWGGTRIGLEGRTKINRKQFGVNWNTMLETGGFLVGDEVTIQLSVQAVRSEDEEE